jgi:DNA invertase Pin-like site-specific DNA recombinase
VTTQDKTLAVYVRTGVHSRSSGQSLAAQEQACRSCASALGWHVGEVFADAGIAGTRRDRPGKGRLLAAVRDGAIERLIIVSPGRLSCRPRDVRTIPGELEGLGVACVSVQQPLHAPRPATKPVEA